MSDLAPFVAAALRDKVIDELLRENAELRGQLEETKVITVTGPNNSPVYAKAQFDSGRHAGAGTRWQVPLVEEKACPLSKLQQVEIRMGGVLLEPTSRSPCTILDFVEGSYDENQRGLFDLAFREDSCVESMSIRVGPFLTEEDYENVYDASEEPFFLACHLSEMANNHVGMTVVFQDISFHRLRVKGSLGNIELPIEETELLESKAAN